VWEGSRRVPAGSSRIHTFATCRQLRVFSVTYAFRQNTRACLGEGGGGNVITAAMFEFRRHFPSQSRANFALSTRRCSVDGRIHGETEQIRMTSSGMLRRVALARTDVSILVTLVLEVLVSYETSVRTRATRPNNPEDGILHSHRSEKLKSYIALTGWTL
jgi:hypothetical protein